MRLILKHKSFWLNLFKFEFFRQFYSYLIEENLFFTYWQSEQICFLTLDEVPLEISTSDLDLVLIFRRPNEMVYF